MPVATARLDLREKTMPVDRPSSSIGDFKLTDNVEHSLDVVRTLRTLREDAYSLAALKGTLERLMRIADCQI